MNMSKAMITRPQRPRPAAAPVLLSDTAVAEVLGEGDAALHGLARMDLELRREMIATAAYFIAEQRGFAPGHELADWCTAEAAIDASLQDTARAA
jgi:Protein of unknown function (DUF2934)